MGKVLVKAVEAQYPVGGGAPVMVLGGGGGGGGGRTKREKLLGALGGTVGALGALTGSHRSLGSLAQSAISGGAQGKQLGRSLARGITSRERQARADREEKLRDARAQESARVKVDYKTELDRALEEPRPSGKSAYEDWKNRRAVGVGVFGGDAAKREWLAGRDPGGQYDSPEAQAERKERESHARWRREQERREGYRDDQKAALAAGQALVAAGAGTPLPEDIRAAAERALVEPGTGPAMIANANTTGINPIAVTGQRAEFLANKDEVVEEPDANHIEEGLDELYEQEPYSAPWTRQFEEEQQKKLMEQGQQEQPWDWGGTAF